MPQNRSIIENYRNPIRLCRVICRKTTQHTEAGATREHRNTVSVVSTNKHKLFYQPLKFNTQVGLMGQGGMSQSSTSSIQTMAGTDRIRPQFTVSQDGGFVTQDGFSVVEESALGPTNHMKQITHHLICDTELLQLFINTAAFTQTSRRFRHSDWLWTRLRMLRSSNKIWLPSTVFAMFLGLTKRMGRSG
jgi:hypothetical protein